MHTSMKPTLRVLSGDQLGREAVFASLPTLESQPFRPGEVPQLLVVDLDEPLSERLEEEAAELGLPRELWLRVAVEASRLLRHAAHLLGVEPSDVIRRVEERTQPRNLTTMEAARYDAYAKQVREGSGSSGRRAPVSRLSIPIPESMVTAWSIDAAAETLTLEEFVNERALEAPEAAMSWEALSAERGQSLGEWMFEALLEPTRPR
jgi:hypothetical protein